MNLMMTETRIARTAANGAAADILFYGTATCAMGEVLVARSDKGVCAILIGDNAEDLETDLTSRFPKSTMLATKHAVRDDLIKVARFMEKPAEGLDLTLDMRGTPFQCRVWEALRTIRAGSTVTYLELAERIDSHKSPRAVGAACAANPIALAIPCHRVLRTDGSLAGYRWGIERKRDLIEKEARA